MATSLENLRAELARQMGKFLTGTATAGGLVTIYDTNGLAHTVRNDQLNGGLAYIRTDAGGAGAAPEGDGRRITDYAYATQAITVEYNFSAAVAAGDVYEVYLVPLVSLEDWNEAINSAIRGAWPGVWKPVAYAQSVVSNQENYAMPAAALDVMKVSIKPGGDFAGYPQQALARPLWDVQGLPGDLDVYLTTPPTIDNGQVRVIYKARYAELAAGESTELDPAYIIASAKARMYELLAAKSGAQADQGDHLRLLSFWQDQAAQLKAKLEAELMGMYGLGGGGKK